MRMVILTIVNYSIFKVINMHFKPFVILLNVLEILIYNITISLWKSTSICLLIVENNFVL